MSRMGDAFCEIEAANAYDGNSDKFNYFATESSGEHAWNLSVLLKDIGINKMPQEAAILCIKDPQKVKCDVEEIKF